MKSPKLLFTLLGLAGFLLLLFLLKSKKKDDSKITSPQVEKTNIQETRSRSHYLENLPPVSEDRSKQYLQDLNQPHSNIQQDLESVWLLVESFNNTLKHNGSIPMGSNRELSYVLFGKNPRQLRFLDPSKPYLNTNGELIDRWGTPFFFHSVENSEIAIRSAGPDQIMWNSDDISYGDFANEFK